MKLHVATMLALSACAGTAAKTPGVDGEPSCEQSTKIRDLTCELARRSCATQQIDQCFDARLKCDRVTKYVDEHCR